MHKFMLAAMLATSGMMASGAMATEVHVTTANPVIDLTISETVETPPDIATFSTGVQTLAPTASAAVRANNAQMASVVARLKTLGIADRDIQTTQINLNQQFDYRDGQQIFKGYQASNMVNAKLRDLTKLGAFLDALAVDGATNFNGPMFGIDDDSSFREAARDKVWAMAIARARSLARKAGYNDVRVLRIEETDNQGRYAAMPIVVRASMNDMGKSTPISPGELSVAAGMSFTFEMVK
ncbi:SIMPL domain-containing protein [Sphingorhabdus sp. EL138]|uniref:SIMPL domain-containing protein n=1 Tax=Sphingorhabdus sp. EL138 TaxID=2073156 RepID=UPI0025D15E9C|nr:SIMPL domain-containing protein [Sphingorhabdus sp. EL138]